MTLHIAVCIKPVPDPAYYDRITIDPIHKTITRQGIPTIISPGDKHALETALQLKDAVGGSVIVFAMAPPEGKQELYEALAMGADEAVLLSDRAFAGADTLATSYTLAQGIKKKGVFDLVLTGTESADGATSQVPAQLAECLGLPHLWNVKAFSLEDGGMLQATVKLEQASARYRVQLPALLAIAREANKPRYTTAMGIMKARRKCLQQWNARDLEVEAAQVGQQGSPTWPGDITAPELGRSGRRISGSPEEIAQELVGILRGVGLRWQSGERGETV